MTRIRGMVAAAVAAVLGIGLAVAPAAAHREGLWLVEDGQPRAVVLVADDADAQTQDAAELLVEYVQKSTGASLPLFTETELRRHGKEKNGWNRLYVGPNRVLDGEPDAVQLLEGLDPDGYLFWPAGNSLTIVGPSPGWGTEYGVHEFLERYLDVRWLLPGPDGEDVPRRSDLAVPRHLVQEEPASIHRVFAPIFTPNNPTSGQAQYEWARHNRMKDQHDRAPGREDLSPPDRVAFHHNLGDVLPPDKYYDEHPEWYPRGERPSFPDRRWQPCFTADGVVEAAVAEITTYFDANPDAVSFALGVNDGRGFCENDPDHPDFPDRLNSQGFQDLSDIYYTWVNDVVEGVLQEHPDKWFGLLAYVEVFDPPSFSVHPRVIPFITDDRMSWAFPEAGGIGRQTTDDWAQAAESLGWYEYLYGGPYAVPRVYFHQMAANYRYGASRGVSAHFAELFPNWGEGPKAWLSAKLQWDPNQDVDALLDEWYESAVGPAAAPDLAAYYAHWEDFWTDRAFNSAWFTRWWSAFPHSHWMSFWDHSYLDLVSDEEIADSRALLESVVAKTETAPQRARAELLLRQFEYYEAAVLSHPSPAPVDTPQGESEALALTDTLARDLASTDRRDRLAQEFAADPVLPTRSPVNSGHSGAALDSHLFWSLAGWVTREEPMGGVVRQRVEELAQDHESTTVREFARLLLAVVDGQPPLTANSSFEDGGTGAPPWQFAPGGGTIARSQDEAATGSFSILAEGVSGGRLAQIVPVDEGTHGVVASFRAPSGSETDGVLRTRLVLFDADGQRVGNLRGGVSDPRGRWHWGRPVEPTGGGWSTTEAVFQVPSGVASARLVLDLDGFAPGERVYLDDVAMYRLD